MFQTTNLGPSFKDGWLELCDGLLQNWKAGHRSTLTGKAKSRLTGPPGNLPNRTVKTGEIQRSPMQHRNL